MFIIQSNEDLVKYLTEVVDNNQTLVKNFNDVEVSAGEDPSYHYSYWLQWHGVELMVSSKSASLAAGILETLKDEDFAARAIESLRFEGVRRLVQLSTCLASRSTSIASNIMEDAERVFWSNLLEKFPRN